jgi:hypothetical protein
VLALTIPYGWLQFKFGILTCLQSASESASAASDLFLFLGPVLLAGFCVVCCCIVFTYFFTAEAIASKNTATALASAKSKMAAVLIGFSYALVWGLNVLYTPITISVLSKFVCSQDPVDGRYYECPPPPLPGINTPTINTAFS